MAGIRLHPQYGVNPTMPTCFWCGQDKGEIALLGAAYKGEAPKNMILDYEPCDKCREHMARGIALIEVIPRHTNKSPPFPGTDHVPTGNFVVITEDACQRLFSGSAGEQAVKMRKAFVEPAVFQPLFATPETEQQSNG